MNKLFFFFFIITTTFLSAQRDHYWGQVYNPESALVGGAVVSGYGGTGAAYYNPATISFVEKSTFSFNVNLMSLQHYRLKSSTGHESEIAVTQLVLQPRFIAALIQPKKLNKIVLEGVLLNSNNYKLELAENANISYDVLADSPGEENYSGFLNYIVRYDERLYGLGGSKKINPNFSLGSSLFVVYKKSTSSSDLTTNASPKSELFSDSTNFYYATGRINERIEYSNYRILAKIGANYQTSKFGLGLNITVPSLNLYGSSNIFREFNQSNIQLPKQNEITKDILITDYQSGLRTNFKDPLSIALGAHIIKNKHFYSISMEYFAGINEYKAIQAKGNPLSTTKEIYDGLTEKDFLSVYHAAKPVLNVAIGHKRYLHENLLLYTGFRTDFSSKKALTKGNNYFSTSHQLFEYNVYHTSIGMDFVFHKTNLIFGVQYSISRQSNLKQLANFDDPLEYNYKDNIALQGEKDNTMEFKYDAVSFYIGLTYSFFREVTGIE